MKQHRFPGLLIAWFLIILAPLLPGNSAGAQPAVAIDPPALEWTGLGNSPQWSNPANWTEINPPTGAQRAPQSGDVLYFGKAAGSPTNNDLASLNLAGIVFSQSGYSLTGNPITLDDLGVSAGHFSGVTSISLALILPQITHFSVENAAAELKLVGQVSGAGGLNKLGAGTLELDRKNTFTGGLRIDEGQVVSTTYGAVGSTSGAINIRPGAILAAAGEYHNFTNSMILAGTVRSEVDMFSTDGDITLEGTGTVEARPGKWFFLDGKIQGVGDLHFSGGGTFVISGITSNTYQGRIIVDSGFVHLSKPVGMMAITGDLIINSGTPTTPNVVAGVYGGNNMFAPSSVVTVKRDGELWLNDTHQSFKGLNGDGGTVSISDHYSLNLTPSGEPAFNFNGYLAGTGIVAVSGTGTQSFSHYGLENEPGFSGSFEMNGTGYLNLHSYQAAGSLVVNTGTIQLYGGCTAGRVTVKQAGTLRVIPDLNSVPVIAGLTMAPWSGLIADLYYSATPGLRVDGEVRIQDANLMVYMSPDAFPHPGETLAVIEEIPTGMALGTFNDLPEGGRQEYYLLNDPGSGGVLKPFHISYAGGDGNDITLTRLAKTVLQLTAPLSAGFGQQIPLTARLLLDDLAVMPAGEPVTFICEDAAAGSAPLAENGEAQFSLPLSKTHVGSLSCAARYAGNLVIDRAASGSATIQVTGQRVMLPMIWK